MHEREMRAKEKRVKERKREEIFNKSGKENDLNIGGCGVCRP